MSQAQTTITRLPPHSEDAERSLLGAILLEGDVLIDVMPLLVAEDFYATSHQKIYHACTRVYQDKGRVDGVLIKDELSRAGDLEK
ncbi:MAG: DnaB-like helicase N-terminal domain-containing protein, partial [Planctomycetota bacterium]